MHKSLLAKFLTEPQRRSSTLLENFVQERQMLEGIVARTLDEVAAAGRDLSAAETETLTKAQTRMAEIDGQTAVISGVIETRSAGQDLDKYLRGNGVILPGGQGSTLEVRDRSAGSNLNFVESDAYRAWGGRGSSDPATFDLSVSQMRAPLMETSAAGTLGSILLPNPPKIQIPQGFAETPLLDVIGRIPVSTNSIELVVYGDRHGATGAAVVAEGAAKPEGALKASVAPVTVDTVAYWVQATRQLLQDAPAAQSLIDSQLRQGMLAKVEDLVATTLEAGTYTTVTGAAKQSLLEVVRLGIAKAHTQGFRVNALVCSPDQAAEFDLALMKATMNGAVMGAGVWGLQIVPVVGVTKPYLGDFRVGVQLVERTGVDIYVTDSHADTFVENVSTILCETRVKPVVVQPAAIVTLAVTP